MMDSPNSIPYGLTILRILKSKGALPYSELKSQSGFNTEKASGKFAYHLKKLLRQSLITPNKSGRRYKLTSLGRTILGVVELRLEKDDNPENS